MKKVDVHDHQPIHGVYHKTNNGDLDQVTKQPKGKLSMETVNMATTASEVQPTNASTQEAKNERTIPSGKSFAQVIQASTLASASSAAAKKYVEDLHKECDRLGLSIEGVVTGTVDAQVVYHKESCYGIALIFAGSTGIAKHPVSDKGNEVVAAFRQHPGMDRIRILKSFVIDETSYDYAGVAAAAILNTIMTVVDEDNNVLTADSFKISNHDIPLVVSTKPDAYRDYIRRVSPFGFSQRDDIGFLVGFPRENCPVAERFNVSPETHIILFACTGYTQFVRIENQACYGSYGQPPKTIRPIIHMSSIVSQNPSMVLLPVAITIAARTFIVHKNWRKPYLLINGKESSNVGNLVLNTDPQTGARSTVDAETPFQADEAMNATCEEPVLAFDITQGRDGIPGIEMLLGGASDVHGHVVNIFTLMQKFYGDKVGTFLVPSNFSVGAGAIHEYTGMVQIDNQVLDSRCADYLRMFRKIGDFGQVAMLLSQPNDPALRLQQLQDFSLTTRSLYNTTSLILSRTMVDFMGHLCPDYEVDLTNDARFNYAFNGIDSAAGIGTLNLTNAHPVNGGAINYMGPYGRW